MRAKPEYRDRPDVEVAVLDALAERGGEGMTVLEVRAAVDTDIDAIEAGLSELKSDGLITVEQSEGRVVILPADRVLPDPEAGLEDDQGLVDAIRDRFGF